MLILGYPGPWTWYHDPSNGSVSVSLALFTLNLQAMSSSHFSSLSPVFSLRLLSAGPVAIQGSLCLLAVGAIQTFGSGSLSPRKFCLSSSLTFFLVFMLSCLCLSLCVTVSSICVHDVLTLECLCSLSSFQVSVLENESFYHLHVSLFVSICFLLFWRFLLLSRS